MRKQKMTNIVIYMYITEDTYHLTYVSFFQMKDSQIPSTPFKGSCAPDDIVPHGSMDVTLQSL